MYWRWRASAAARGDALGEQDGVEQPLRQLERARSDSLRAISRVPGPGPRAASRLRALLLGRSSKSCVVLVVLHRTILPCKHARIHARSRWHAGFPNSKASCPKPWTRPGSGAPRRPRRTSACRRASPPRCAWARSKRSNTSAIAAWASRCTSASARARPAPPTCRREPWPRRWRRPATSRATPPRTSARARGSRGAGARHPRSRSRPSVGHRARAGGRAGARLRGRRARGRYAHHQFRRRHGRQPPGRARVRQFARLPRGLSVAPATA